MDMPDYYDEMQADAVDDVDLDGIPEGCTPADARKLREANHALAIELHEYKEKTRERLVEALGGQEAIGSLFANAESARLIDKTGITCYWHIEKLDKLKELLNEVLGNE